jgi:hypothetical protein
MKKAAGRVTEKAFCILVGKCPNIDVGAYQITDYRNNSISLYTKRII